MDRGATKGGLKGAQAPPAPKGVPCNSARSDDFFLVRGWGVLALALL